MCQKVTILAERDMKVYLVEDEEILKTKLVSYLEQLELICYSFTNIDQSRSHLNKQKEPIDLFILDHRLPDGLGIDLAKEIKELQPNSTILLMTAHSETSLAINALNLGIDYYLEKPFKKDLFISTVKDLLDKQKQKVKIEELHIQFSIKDSSKEKLTIQFDLSNREIEVIEHLFLYDKNELIAKKLFISVGTVKNHLSTIYQKTFVANKRELKELIQKLNLEN